MRLDRFRRSLYRLTYDKPAINQKALQLSRSLEEVKKALAEQKISAGKNRKQSRPDQ